MSHPEYIYYALLVLLVIPSMPWNRMAIVVVLCWLPGQVLGWGFPFLNLTPVDLTMNIWGLLVGRKLAYNSGTVLVTILYAPMILIGGMELAGMADANHAYWALYWTAILQVIFVPLGNNWRPFCKWLYRRGWTDNPDLDFHFRTYIDKWLERHDHAIEY